MSAMKESTKLTQSANQYSLANRSVLHSTLLQLKTRFKPMNLESAQKVIRLATPALKLNGTTCTVSLTQIIQRNAQF